MNFSPYFSRIPSWAPLVALLSSGGQKKWHPSGRPFVNTVDSATCDSHQHLYHSQSSLSLVSIAIRNKKSRKNWKKNLETKKHLNAENAFNNRLPKEIYSDCRVTSEKKTLGGLFFITVFVRIWVNVWRRTVIRNFEQDSNPGPNCQWAYDHFGRLLSWSSRNGRLFGQKSRERKFIVRDYHSAFWIPRRADLNSLLY